MKSGKKISAIQVSSPNIIQIAPDPTSDSRRIIISGTNSGAVTITLTDEDNKKEVYEVVVQLDVQYLQNLIKRAVPTSSVEIIPLLNRGVVLKGWVAMGGDVETVMSIARNVLGQGAQVINGMRVGGVQQVQLDVTVASVSRTEARRRGFNFAYNGGTISTGSILGGLAASTASTATSTSGAGGVGIVPGTAQLLPNSPPSGTNIVFGVVPANLQLLIQALRDENLAKLLAEPKLITMSGRPAHMLAGGQQAVLSASGSIGGPGVDYRDVGTELDFLPIVLGNGRIYLEVNPRVRSVNQALGITTSFGFVPGFSEQTVRTMIEMEPGQTFAIGGLIQTTIQASSERVPVLGDLPFVGGFFNTIFHSEQEDELVILVTPHLVDAMDCNQAPKHLPGRETRSPDDYELFLEYIFEAPRGQRQVWENGRYKAAYKSDPSFGQFPCADPVPREPRLGVKTVNGSPASATCSPAGTTCSPAPATVVIPNGLPRGVDPAQRLNQIPVMPPPPGTEPKRLAPSTGTEVLPPPNPAKDGKGGPTADEPPMAEREPR